MLNLERLLLLKGFIDKLDQFIKSAYLGPTSPAIGASIRLDQIRRRHQQLPDVPDCPLDTKGTVFDLFGGFIAGGDLKSFKPITTFNDEYFRDGVSEAVKHAWYNGDKALHPGRARRTAVPTSRTTASIP